MLYKIKSVLRNSKLGNYLTNIILKTKCANALYKIFDKLNLTDASHLAETNQEMAEKSKIFFKKNKNRIEKILTSLADTKSKEVYQKIITFRCSLNKKNLPEYSLIDSYFPKDIIRLKNDEVFVDCGAYTGDTILKFIEESRNNYKKIIAFEPDKNNFDILNKRKFDKTICFQIGTWDKKDKLKFIQDGSESSKLEQTTSITTHFENKKKEVIIQLDSIDNIKECSDMTFLKMDIEGAELNALKGAEKTIRKNHPKLAICIYHSNEDVLNIIEWVFSLNMGYKLYVRHHFGGYGETILYAI